MVKARPSNQNREVRLFVRKRETNERAEERNWDHGKMGFCRVGELKSRQIWECTIRLFMKKSMDDIGLRKKIVKLLRDEGATSSEEELNRAVMNMLKILPPARSAKSSRTAKLLDAIQGPFPFPPPRNPSFTFIDLFAGIGGFRLAFQKAGGRSVFCSEWDEYAQMTYKANYGEVPQGDIRAINVNDIPNHDVLCAGFPCQPFSLAGVSKKNALGRATGFDDLTQGTLFFEIRKILQAKRPAAFFLENVKNLMSHDHGRTFHVIRGVLQQELGYVLKAEVVDGKAWVPQHRERVFIVGFDPRQIDIAEEEINIPHAPLPREHFRRHGLADVIQQNVDGYTLGPGTWATLERHKAHHEEVGNGFGYGIIRWPIAPDAVTRTISARYYKDGAEILVEQPGNRPRRLTVREAMQLQGYDPERFVFPVTDCQAYKQIGNSVVWPAICSCALEIARVLRERRR